MLIVIITIFTPLFIPVTSYAKVVTKNNYDSITSEHEVYADYGFSLYNACSLTGSVTIKAGTAREVNGKFYGSDNDTVIITWKNCKNCFNIYLAEKLEVWQANDGISGSNDYNNGGESDIISIMGKATGYTKIGGVGLNESNATMTVKLSTLKNKLWICGSRGSSDVAPKFLSSFNYIGGYVGDDKTKPTISASISGDSSNGYFKSGSTISFTAKDSASGVASITANSKTYKASSADTEYSKNLSVTNTTEYSYYATDVAGNVSDTKTKAVKIDNIAPSNVTIASSGNNNWTSSANRLTLAAQDTQAGLDHFIVQYSANNSTWSNYKTVANLNAATNMITDTSVTADKSGYYRVVAYDVFGNNSTSTESVQIKIDTVTPTASHSIVDNAGSPVTAINGYYKDVANIKITGSTTGASGISSICYGSSNACTSITSTNPYIFTGVGESRDGLTYYYKSVSASGVSSAVGSVNIKLDKSAPTISISGKDPDAWTNQPQPLSISGSDSASGVSHYQIQRSTDNGQNYTNYEKITCNNETSVSKTFNITENGTYRVIAYDRVGHTSISPQSITYTHLDVNEKPIVTSKANATEVDDTAEFDWYKNKAIVTITAEDKLSGIDILTINDTEYSGNGSLSITKALDVLEGVSTYKSYATDIAGNISETNTLEVKVDATKPANVGITADTVTWSNTTVAATVTASDAHSGLRKFILQKDTKNDISTIASKDELKDKKFTFVNVAELEAKGENELTTKVFNISENGIYRVVAYDRVGLYRSSFNTSDEDNDDSDNNNGNDIIIVKNIEKTPPLISSIIIDPEISGYTIPFNEWHNENALLSVTAKDDKAAANEERSGIDYITLNNVKYSDEITDIMGTNVINFPMFKSDLNTFVYSSTDRAGNISQELTTKIMVDDKKPTELNIVLDEPSSMVNYATGVNVTVSAKDTQSGVKYLKLMYSTDLKNWSEYNYPMGSDGSDGYQEDVSPDKCSIIYKDFDGITETAATVYNVKHNGFYKLLTNDEVAHIIDSVEYNKELNGDNNYDTEDTNNPPPGVIVVDDIDSKGPDGLAISPDTTDWVNEATGVELTSYAADEDSGIESVECMEFNTSSKMYATAKKVSYTLLKDENTMNYPTHLNGYFKTAATDGVGNYSVMPDEESLEVPNIDPIDPTVTLNVDTTKWVNETNGFPITVYAQDHESGLSELKIEKLDTESGDWNATNINYTEAEYITGEEKYDTNSTNKIKNIYNNAVLSFKNLLNGKERTINSIENGTNEMCKITFPISENGTYRVSVNDMVLNSTKSSAVTVSTVDNTKPVLIIEGNPTEWTNEDATIVVTALDYNSGIKTMTLNDEEKKFTSNGNASSFTFTVDKNAKFTVAATDNAGNSVSEIVDVTKIDKVAPSVDSVLSSWDNGTCTATLNIEDDLSGIKSAYLNNTTIDIKSEKATSYKKDIVADNVYLVTVTDKAGNKTTSDIDETKILKSIKITTPPDKTKYIVGENFNKTGMVVTAYYTDGSNRVISNYEILDQNNLKLDRKSIKVSYTEKEVTCTDKTPIEVSEGSGGDNGNRDNDNGGNNNNTPSTSAKTTPKVYLPKTGDTTNITIFIIASLFCITLIIAILIFKRKINTSNKK